jgi:hypothetical protein
MIQSTWKGKSARLQATRTRALLVKLQSLYRGRMGRALATSMRMDADRHTREARRFSIRVRALRACVILSGFVRTSVRRIRRTQKSSSAGKVLTTWYRAYRPLMRARKLLKGFRRLQVCIHNSRIYKDANMFLFVPHADIMTCQCICSHY